MRTRQEIKEYAKGAFIAQRGTCVLGLFLVMLLTVGFSIIGNIPTITTNITLLAPEYNFAALGALTAIGFVISLLAIPVMLLSFILNVNISGFFVKVYYGQPVKYSEPYSEISTNFGRKLGGMLWEFLWLYLWSLAFMAPAIIISTILITSALTSLLFMTPYNLPAYVFLVPLISLLISCIPVIIKALSYSMTQYILASNPNVLATNAIKLSMRMTKGHKGKIFVMWISFIGWQLLNMLTLGILGIFYVNPYMYASFAGQFVELRSLAVASGVILPHELDGVPQQYLQSYQYNQAYGNYQQQPLQQYTSDPYQQQQYTSGPYQQQQYSSDLYQQQAPPPYSPYYVPEGMQNPIPQVQQTVQEVQQPQIPQAPPIPEPPPDEPPAPTL